MTVRVMYVNEPAPGHRESLPGVDPLGIPNGHQPNTGDLLAIGGDAWFVKYREWHHITDDNPILLVVVRKARFPEGWAITGESDPGARRRDVS